MEQFLEVFLEPFFIPLVYFYVFIYTLKVNLYTKSKYAFLSGSTGVSESFLQRGRIKSVSHLWWVNWCINKKVVPHPLAVFVRNENSAAFQLYLLCRVHTGLSFSTLLGGKCETNVKFLSCVKTRGTFLVFSSRILGIIRNLSFESW